LESIRNKKDYTGLDDQALLALELNGEEPAFRQLFDRYYKSIVLTALRITKEPNLAKDAAQEVFLELWRNREKIHIKQSILAYLKRGAVNRSLNIIKSRKLHMGQSDTAELSLPTKLSGPDQQTESNELKAVIHQSIQELPDRCRQVFVLCRQEGFSHKEVAEQLQISPKTVENQMTKALKSLRGKLRMYLSDALTLLISLKIFWEMDGCLATLNCLIV